MAAGLERSGSVDRSLAADPHGFDPREAHGVCNRRGWRLHASSAALGWRNLFVSSQTEIPEEAAAGGATLAPGGEGFTVRIFDTVDSAHIYLRHEMIERVIDERGIATRAPQVQPFFGVQKPLIEHLALACVAALKKPSRSASFYVDHLAWAMAAHLVETHGRPSIVPSIVHYPGLTDRQLKRAEEYMFEHMDGDLGVEDLAAAAGLSAVYFARQFKLRTGCSPHRYLRSLRVNRAKELLGNDYMSIAEIALNCGFCHQEHMTRVFRAECGTKQLFDAEFDELSTTLGCGPARRQVAHRASSDSAGYFSNHSFHAEDSSISCRNPLKRMPSLVGPTLRAGAASP